MFDTIRTSLTADVADAGNFTVGYPDGRDAGSYAGGTDHEVASHAYGILQASAGEISVSFGSSNITITNNSGQTLAANTAITVQLDMIGPDESVVTPVLMADRVKMRGIELVMVNLGAPDVSDSDGAVKSQACTVSGGLATGIDGDLASGGVATFDVPRAVVAAWTTSAKITVTGTDAYGNTIVETTASAGTSHTGKKAFKTVTGISSSADITGLTVGTGKVLGLPSFLEGAGYVVAEIQDGAKAAAGTAVGGDTATATATTGDVRGTYAPNAAPDGSKVFQVLCALDDPSNKGLPQYAG